MIDFNTILNTLFQAAVEQHTKPLLDTIAEQERRILSMEEFFNKWNFGGEETFKAAVMGVVGELDEKIEGIVDGRIHDEIDAAIDNYDFSDKLSDAIDNYDFSDKIDESKIEDAVREVLGNATITTEISL